MQPRAFGQIGRDVLEEPLARAVGQAPDARGDPGGRVRGRLAPDALQQRPGAPSREARPGPGSGHHGHDDGGCDGYSRMPCRG